MPTLYLIDGYAQFFRAYHAIRSPLTSPVTKEPTNMTFGFIGMLLKLLRGQGKIGGKPAYVAVALDVGGDRGTFRSQIYPDYKAHRPPPPEDLFVQVDRCLAILREVGVPLLGVEGFEADDVIATLVTRLRRDHPDLTIRIVSKDKDLKQLLQSPQREQGAAPGDSHASNRVKGDREPTLACASGSEGSDGCVEMFDIHNDEAITADTLLTDTGLRPDQVRDMLTLMGDTADNVPGVEGVGEKTSAMLIKEYGDLDNLIAHAAEIKGKRGEKIREWIPRSPLTKELISLRHDVPFDFNLESAKAHRFALATLIPLCKTLGFNRYQDEVRALLSEPEAQARVGVPSTPSSPMPEAAFESNRAREVRKPPPPAGTGGSDGLFAAHAAAEVPDRPALGNYRCITTREQLAQVVAELKAATVIALDTETTELSPLLCNLCGVSFSTKIGTGVYIPIRSPSPERHLDEATVLETLRPILCDPAKEICGHNLKYDLVVLRNAGLEPANIAFDSMVASYLIDSSRSSHGLEALSLALLTRGKSSISELIGSGKHQRSFITVPIEAATTYAAADADLALALREQMLPQLRAMELMPLFEKVEMPLVRILAEMEFNGIIVDADELERQRRRLTSKINEILNQLDAESVKAINRKFDPNSPKQLAAVLFNATDAEVPGLGLKGSKKTKTGYSTDAEVLEDLGEDATIQTPIPRLILEYRQFSKLVSTYLVALREAINPRTRRVHTSFHQTVAATGRLASSDPNLQNIPIRTEVGRDIRKAFIAAPGHVLITADYSQIELRLLAHLSRDPALIDAFMTGQDIHQQVAAQIHGVPLDQVTKDQRSGAKMVNFGIVYGITAFGLARRLGVSNTQADEIITGYKKRFTGITTFLHECVEQAKRFGHVETILKRRRPIPDINSKNPSHRAFAERTAINSVVQGSAADLIKLAMVAFFPSFRTFPSEPPAQAGGLSSLASLPPGVKMLLQIHDELVFECPEDRADEAMPLIVNVMESAMTLTVPLKVDAHIGRNWFEGK